MANVCVVCVLCECVRVCLCVCVHVRACALGSGVEADVASDAGRGTQVRLVGAHAAVWAEEGALFQSELASLAGGAGAETCQLREGPRGAGQTGLGFWFGGVPPLLAAVALGQTRGVAEGAQVAVDAEAERALVGKGAWGTDLAHDLARHVLVAANFALSTLAGADYVRCGATLAPGVRACACDCAYVRVCVCVSVYACACSH